jgi:hypothetical protein
VTIADIERLYREQREREASERAFQKLLSKARTRLRLALEREEYCDPDPESDFT